MSVKEILNEDQYEAVMEEILDLMNKGERNLTLQEEETLKDLAISANAYERKYHREISAKISHSDIL